MTERSGGMAIPSTEAMAEYIGCECDTLRKRVAELERERDEARKRVAELEDVNLAARRRLESLEVSMGEKMPLGAHAALSCLREKGGA